MIILHCLFDFTLFGCKRDALALGLFRRPLLVEEKVSYFPFVEKHFLFLAQALNCWIPAEKEEFSISYLCVQCILCVFVPDCIRKNASSQCLYEVIFGFWCEVLGLVSEAWGFRSEVT